MPQSPGVRFDYRKAGACVAVGVVLAAVLAATASGLFAGSPRPGTYAVNTSQPGRAVPAGYLGVGIEYQTLADYNGHDYSGAVNPVLVRLLSNLTPAQTPILRIGGDTTDWSSWGPNRPPGVSYSITPRWLAMARPLDQSLGARLILGINFEAGTKAIAQSEAQALVNGFGAASVQALELGNEPELYHAYGWYKNASGKPVVGRPANWGFPMFRREFTSISASLPPVPLAGPTTGNPWWDPDFARFLSGEPRVKLATIHRYPLWICSKRHSPLFPTVDHLLSAKASVGLAQRTAPFVRIAHARGIPLRVDEMNITPCPSNAKRLRPSVATALWSADILFEMASVGVDGVNFQTTTGPTDDLFSFSRGAGGFQAAVFPEYYGLLMFARAVPAGARLIPVSPAPSAGEHVWATRAPGGTVHVLAINDRPKPTTIHLEGLADRTSATVERLQATSTHGDPSLTLGGRTLGEKTGALSGQEQLERVSAHDGSYDLLLPARSASLLTVG